MATKVAFAKATKKKAKLRLALHGVAGSGKTYTALRIASGLGKKIALIDTEHGSASKYANEFEFDALELESFHPDRFIEAIRAAEEGGYDVVIIDSMSHAWAGVDGALDQIDKIKKRTGGSFQAWADVTPMFNKLVEAINGSKIHVIATMRAKQDHSLEKDEKTKQTTVKKLGLAPIMRENIEYEFDVTARLDSDNNLIVDKTRCPALRGAIVHCAGPEVAATLAAWLADGGAETPKLAVVPPGDDVDVIAGIRAEFEAFLPLLADAERAAANAAWDERKGNVGRLDHLLNHTRKKVESAKKAQAPVVDESAHQPGAEG